MADEPLENPVVKRSGGCATVKCRCDRYTFVRLDIWSNCDCGIQWIIRRKPRDPTEPEHGAGEWVHEFPPPDSGRGVCLW